MTKNTENPVSLHHDWWIYNTIKNSNQPDYYPHPVCEFAELYYLAYIIFQNTIRNKNRLKYEIPVHNTTLISFDRRKNTKKITIQ